LGISDRFLSPGVGNRPSDEQPSGHVNERQTALCGSLSQKSHDLGHALWRLAPVAALGVHVGCAARAFTVGRGDDAERPACEQGFELGASTASVIASGSGRWITLMKILAARASSSQRIARVTQAARLAGHVRIEHNAVHMKENANDPRTLGGYEKPTCELVSLYLSQT
jgi:hypothetical protein